MVVVQVTSGDEDMRSMVSLRDLFSSCSLNFTAFGLSSFLPCCGNKQNNVVKGPFYGFNVVSYLFILRNLILMIRKLFLCCDMLSDDSLIM